MKEVIPSFVLYKSFKKAKRENGIIKTFYDLLLETTTLYYFWKLKLMIIIIIIEYTIEEPSRSFKDEKCLLMNDP